MGKVNAWLMSMEDLAEQAIERNLSEAEAVQFIRSLLETNYKHTSDHTLRQIYRKLITRYRDLDIGSLAHHNED